MNRLPRVLIPALLLASGAPAPAADYNMKVSRYDIRLGQPVCGPRLTNADLEGHVVVLQYWELNGPPCLVSTPKLAKLYDELGPAGLIVIGAHFREAAPGDVRAQAELLGVGYPVMSSVTVEEGMDFGTIPHCYLFDHTGKCRHRGPPDEGLFAKTRELVGAALIASLDRPKFARLAHIVDGLKKGQPPIPQLHKALPLVNTIEPTTAQEAKLLAAKLNDLGQRQIDEAAKLKDSDGPAAYARLLKVAADFKGTPAAKQASDELSALRRDRILMAEVDARRPLNTVRTIDLLLHDAPGHDDPKSPAFQRANAATLKKLQSALRQMKHSWPEAKATQEALTVGEKYGVVIP